MKKFKGYQSLSEDKPSGFYGKKAAYLDELRFMPITEPSVRVDALTVGNIDCSGATPTYSVPNPVGITLMGALIGNDDNVGQDVGDLTNRLPSTPVGRADTGYDHQDPTGGLTSPFGQ